MSEPSPHLRIIGGKWIVNCPNCGLPWGITREDKRLLCVKDDRTPGCQTEFDIPWPDQADELFRLSVEHDAIWHPIWATPEEFKEVIDDPNHVVMP